MLLNQNFYFYGYLINFSVIILLGLILMVKLVSTPDFRRHISSLALSAMLVVTTTSLVILIVSVIVH